MKLYLILMSLGSILVLAIRVVTDYQNNSNPFHEPLLALNYVILIFWIIFFPIMYFKKC
ncbi:hypothetical protein LYSBPC_32840 [Lysinibacillus piscis]|uniref:Short-chain dehydrogenase n=1 Tax=Lysinibacillus piscis TaxID=2518931 RepID=A0ABQ5NPV6_9BACI|nr:hypothetical protein LYSBPC_32840 [Lysinibacillus sp. KH24]